MFFEICSLNHMCQSLNHQSRRPATLSKKRIKHRCFPVNIEKILRQIFYKPSPVAASAYASKQNYSRTSTSEINKQDVCYFTFLVLRVGVFIFSLRFQYYVMSYKMFSEEKLSQAGQKKTRKNWYEIFLLKQVLRF